MLSKSFTEKLLKRLKKVIACRLKISILLLGFFCVLILKSSCSRCLSHEPLHVFRAFNLRVYLIKEKNDWR